jgi:hypothetical protein
MAREKVKQVQVFSLPTEYERQAAEARRREMMAEMLAQQAYDPGQYQGAPIPKAAPVVKALEGYLRGREMRKAREAGEKAEAEVSRSGQQIMGRLMGGAPIAEPVMPDASGLDEVRVQSQYRASPDDAMRMAMTPAGSAAMRGNPALAAMLARTMERPEAEEFYAPTETEGGLVQFGKRGGMRETGLKPSPKAPSPTQLARLIAERDALPQNDPKRSMYDAAIKGETQGRGTTVNLPPSPRDLRKDEGGLRDELKGRLKEMDWEGVRSAYQRIFTAPENAVGDVAIVYAVAKADDPTGAVRKEDFDLRAKDGSLGGRIKALYEEAKSGRMLPDRRQQLIDTAYELYTARQNDVNSLLGQYQEIATRSGLDVQNVVNPFKAKPLERRIVWTPEKQKELDELNRKRQAQGR